MKNLGDDLLRIVEKRYEPNKLVEKKFRNLDLTFKTDAEGRAILLYLGQKGPDGRIKGERYARRLKQSGEGLPLKDHWDHKGKAT